jgi:hypothetical protein
MNARTVALIFAVLATPAQGGGLPAWTWTPPGWPPGQGWERWERTQRPSANIEDFRISPDADWVLVFHTTTGEEFLPPRGPAYDGYGYKTGYACVAAGNKAIEAYPTLTFQCADLGFLPHLFDKLGK